jgi:hypothetical protein
MNEQNRRVLSNDPKYAELKKITTSENGANSMRTIINMLTEARNLDDSIINTDKKSRELSHVITETHLLTTKILDRLKEMNKEPDNLNNMAVMHSFKDMLDEWQELYRNLTQDIGKSAESKSALFSMIGSVKNNIDFAIDQINENNDPYLVKILTHIAALNLSNVKKGFKYVKVGCF